MSIPDPIVLLDARARYVHPAFQMTRASTKTVFDATGKLVTVPANAIGWDHDPATGQARGYLVEPSATNLLLHSNDLTQSSWSKFQSSVTGDAITGPDGNGMDKLVEDSSASTTHSVYQTFTINDGAATVFQLIAKAGERQSVRAQIRNGDSPQANRAEIDVSLTDGTISNANEAGTCELIDYGAAHISSGFYFIWIAATIGSGNTSARVQAQLVDGNGDINYTGDGTSGLYVGYCQAEEGSYPTSYIETGAATATRSAEQLVLADPADYPWWSHDAGTLILDYVNRQKIGGSVYWQLGDMRLAESMVGDLRVAGAVLESDRVLISAQSYLPRRRYVVAVSWDGEIMKASANGAAAVSRGMIADPTSDLRLGWHPGGWASSPSATFARAVYYPAPLSNADLQSLTAIQE